MLHRCILNIWICIKYMKNVSAHIELYSIGGNIKNVVICLFCCMCFYSLGISSNQTKMRLEKSRPCPSFSPWTLIWGHFVKKTYHVLVYRLFCFSGPGRSGIYIVDSLLFLGIIFLKLHKKSLPKHTQKLSKTEFGPKGMLLSLVSFRQAFCMYCISIAYILYIFCIYFICILLYFGTFTRLQRAENWTGVR